MRELVWPERQRCRACRCYFGFAVYHGLFCSRRCAGMPPSRCPSPMMRTRSACRGAAGTPCSGRPKLRYRCEQDVLDAINVIFVRPDRVRPGVYQCDNCGFFHMGNQREPALAG